MTPKQFPVLPVLIALVVLVIGILVTALVMQQGNATTDRLQAAAEAATQIAQAATRAAITPPTITPRRGRPTLPPSWTPTFTPTPSDTFTPSATRTPTFTPSDTATHTPTATPTFTPTFTPPPTATPTATPTPSQTLTPSITPNPTATRLPLPGAPTAVPPVSTNGADIFNVLLLGSDIRPGEVAYRTDAMIVVSVNRTAGAVTMLSLPRDMYLYIPGYGMQRINTASLWGDLMKWPGRGEALIAETITYNLGIKIDRYARVDFAGFKQLIDAIGGVEVPVDCPVTDYRLARPDLNPNVPSNYKLFTLPIGVHEMDGSLALWYARSRIRSSDFDRNRRQQELLRAMWQKIRAEGLTQHLPQLWDEVTKIVKTNLTLGDVIGLLPLALDVEGLRLRNLFLDLNHVRPQDIDGAAVMVPIPAAVRKVVERMYQPPTANVLAAEEPTVAVYNASSHADWGQVAAARLAWEGFQPTYHGLTEEVQQRTVVYDYTGGAKPGSLRALLRALNADAKAVIEAPDPNAQTDFKVVIGERYNACTFNPYGANLQ
jgi:LCP family protein required for cell wall assembly